MPDGTMGQAADQGLAGDGLNKMRVAMVHNYYLVRGGEDESFESEARMLREHGHAVTSVTEHNERVRSLGYIRTAVRTVWSVESYDRLRTILRREKSDILHVQNFFPLLSPSVYYAARAEGVPVVQTLRDYRLYCPDGRFFRDGRACEDCLDQLVPISGIIHACYRGSMAATATVATMLTVHRALGTWNRLVDVYIALTDFARRKFIQGGVPAEKLVVRPNSIHPDPGVGQHRGGYALFVGRLSPEKGVDTLLDAWERIDRRWTLRIVGDGPLTNLVARASARSSGVEYLGRLPVEDVYALLAEARVLVFPSSFYETFGRVAIEAFAHGTPVIGANIGAIAEVTEDGRTGLLFKPADAADLAAKLEWAWEHPQSLAAMGREARREYETKYTAAVNYPRLLDIYQLATARSRDRR